MKQLLLLLIAPTISAFLYDLSAVDQKCDTATLQDLAKNGFTKYFGIPLGDDQATFSSFSVIDSENNPVDLTWPTAAKITGRNFGAERNPTVCYNGDKHDNVKGKIYFLETAYKDMEVYYLSTNYTVTVTSNYTVLFSKTSGGSTLRNFQTDSASFQIYPGLPGDSENPFPIYTYDSASTFDEILIAEDHFYILNTGSKGLNFSVTDPVSAKDNTFDSKGFIISQGFPKLPPADYLNLDVKLKQRTVDKRIKITVNARKAVVAMEEEIQLAEGDANLKVTVGGEECVINVQDQVITESCTQTLSKSTDKFNVLSTSAAYILEFELEDVPSTQPVTTTTSKPTTTVKPTLAPGGTCAPAVTCPPQVPCTNATCPTVTCPTAPVCSCFTSTTEISTTTMGSSSTTVTSLLSLLSVYYVL